MNYQRIYNQIIKRAQNRTLEGYKEKHHIVPKCMGGNNNKENLVELTAREHFLCHMLLCEIHPTNGKLKQSIWLMSIGKQRNNTLDSYKINNRMYEKLKIEFSKIAKERMENRHVTEDTRKKMSVSKKDKKQSTETKLKRSISLKGKPLSNEHKKKIGKSNTGVSRNMGRKSTKETKLKQSLALKGKKKINMSEETKQKISRANTGKHVNEKTKQKISKSNQGKVKPLGFGENIRKNRNHSLISEKLKGRTLSNETKLKQSLAKKNKPSNSSKKIIQFDIEYNFIKEWDSITEAKKSLGKGDIQSCVLGKQKTAGGFIWRYKN
jgi:hypothetical protein